MNTQKKQGELKRIAREYLTGNYPVAIFTMLAASALPAFLLSFFSVGDTFTLNIQTGIYLLAAAISELFWTFCNHPDRFIPCTALFVVLQALFGIAIGFSISQIAIARSATAIVLYSALALLAAIIFFWTSYTYRLVYFLYIDHPEYTVLQGFRESRRLMQGHKWRFFLLQLSFAGMVLLGLCSLGIGFLWIFPYINQTTTTFYMDRCNLLPMPAVHIDATITDQATFHNHAPH